MNAFDLLITVASLGIFEISYEVLDASPIAGPPEATTM
jgi:hypothetical protein